MYERIWKDYKADFFKRNPRLPREKSFSIGRALWAISRAKRIKFVEIAARTGLSEGPLLRMASSHKLTTTPEKIKTLADALGVNLKDFFLAAREEFFGNFFITKARMPREEEVREYKRHGLFLQKQTVLKYPDSDAPDYRVICYTPPIESLSDFFSAALLISPGKTLKGFKLPSAHDIHLAVVTGAVQIESENETIEEIIAGQTVLFNGSAAHSIRNLSGDREAEILIGFTPTETLGKRSSRRDSKDSPETDFDIPFLIEETRKRLSPDPNQPIPLSEAAALAGLRPRDLDPLVKGNFKNLPIEKLLRLAEALQIPFEAFLMGEAFKPGLNPRITRGLEKGICDYRARYGVTFYPWMKPGLEKKKLFMGQAVLEGRRPEEEHLPGASVPLKEKIWEGATHGCLLAKGMSGKLGVESGKRHNYPEIDPEDTVYLDMSLGFSFRNFSSADPTNLFLISSPPLF